MHKSKINTSMDSNNFDMLVYLTKEQSLSFSPP